MQAFLKLNVMWLVLFSAKGAVLRLSQAPRSGSGSIGTAAAEAIQQTLDVAASMNIANHGSATGQRELVVASQKLPTEAQKHFKASQIGFSTVSKSGRSPEELAIARNLAAAMQSTPKVGNPTLNLVVDSELACLPDVNRCPVGWEMHGALCIASEEYQGPCKSQTALFDMHVEERLAFARYCQVKFPCQDECFPNLNAACPSLWQPISGSVCEAPGNYVGKCSHRVRTGNMTEKDKIDFGFKCGARWPCVAPPSRSYADVCPDGWTLISGQSCRAPVSYSGPCAAVARLGGMTRIEKQIFEASCDAVWPIQEDVCEPDYGAPCPHHWQQRKKRRMVECVAPPMYKGCSRVQSFHNFSPVEKSRWTRNCGQPFPCVGGLDAHPAQGTVQDGPLSTIEQR